VATIRQAFDANREYYVVVLAFLVHSPFLTLFSLVWLPVWWYFCRAEEQDLLLRYGRTYEEYRRRTGMFWPKGKGDGPGLPY